jgi:hypothetical protein
MASLKWFLRWYRRRAVKTKILIALLILVTFLGCFGALSPPSTVQRGARSSDRPAAPSLVLAHSASRDAGRIG